MGPAPFEVHMEELEGGVRAITVRGELDMNTAPELERCLDRLEDGDRALIDLCECEFIDSTGIALLMRAWQRLDSGGGEGGAGRLILCSVNHQVRRLLTITGVESSVSMHEERDAALAELRG